MPEEENNATMAPDQQPEEQNEGGLLQALKYMHLAFVLPCSAVAGWFLGGLADRWIGTTWISRAGAVLGIGAGIFEMARILLKIKRENQ